MTADDGLAEIIRQGIAARGPITFAEFMGQALYHPSLGYYNRRSPPMGVGGDYLTSPETSRIFGATLSRHCLEIWQFAGCPDNWRIIELGGGSGRLCRDVIDGLFAESGNRPAGLRYTIVESSSVLRSEQARTVGERAEFIDWVDSPEELSRDIAGHILSNEFFDALPFHRVTVDAGVLREICVGLDDAGRFVDQACDPTPGLHEYFGRLHLLPGEGSTAEVNLEAPRVFKELGARLRRGAVTTFDYGYEAADLYAAWRSQGTLLCFYRHSYSADPYERVGRQDITAHVDFTSLRHAGLEVGLEPAGLASQMEFLTTLGVEGWLTSELDLEQRMARRRAIQALIDPAGLGRIRVLVMRKDES